MRCGILALLLGVLELPSFMAVKCYDGFYLDSKEFPVSRFKEIDCSGFCVYSYVHSLYHKHKPRVLMASCDEEKQCKYDRQGFRKDEPDYSGAVESYCCNVDKCNDGRYAAAGVGGPLKEPVVPKPGPMKVLSGGGATCYRGFETSGTNHLEETECDSEYCWSAYVDNNRGGELFLADCGEDPSRQREECTSTGKQDSGKRWVNGYYLEGQSDCCKGYLCNGAPAKVVSAGVMVAAVLMAVVLG